MATYRTRAPSPIVAAEGAPACPKLPEAEAELIIAAQGTGLEIEVADGAAGRRVVEDGNDELPQLPVNRTASSPSRQAQSQQELDALRTARRNTRGQAEHLGSGEELEHHQEAGHAPMVSEWRQDRDAAISELSFRLDIWVSSTVYELLPSQIAFVLVCATKGLPEAMNRYFVENQCGKSMARCLLAVPVLDAVLQSYIAIAICFYYQPLLPPTAVYETVGYIVLPLLCRAATIGIKYAMFSDVLLSKDVGGSLRSHAFREESMQSRAQMTSYISNADGRHKESLVKELYASCLCANADLSCAALTWVQHEDEQPDLIVSLRDDAHGQGARHEEPTAPSDQEQVGRLRTIQAVWADLAAMLAGVADAHASFTQLDTDHSGDVSLAGVCVCVCARARVC